MSSKNPRIVYMGTPRYAEVILERLIEAEDMDVVLVVTQPDRPVGRKKVLTPPPVKTLAHRHGIEVVQPERLSDAGVNEMIAAMEPDFIIVAAFGQLLPRQTLDIAPCINLHASLLPQYRGASPVQQSLLNGDRVTGVTSMLMEEGLDTGDILEKVEFVIPPDMRLHALTEQLTQDAAALTLSTIRRFDTLVPIPQDESRATRCKKIRRGDGEVDLRDATDVYNRYRAFEGWPGIFLANGTKLDALVRVADDGEHTPGTILAFDDDVVVVGCGRGALSIGQLQPPSKKPMSAKAYCVGRSLRVGDSIV